MGIVGTGIVIADVATEPVAGKIAVDIEFVGLYLSQIVDASLADILVLEKLEARRAT